MSNINYHKKYIKYKKKYLDLKNENEGGFFKGLTRLGKTKPTLAEEEKNLRTLRTILFTGLNTEEINKLEDDYLTLMNKGIFYNSGANIPVKLNIQRIPKDFTNAGRFRYRAIPLINKLFFLNEPSYEIEGKKVNTSVMEVDEFINYVKKNLEGVKFQKINQMVDIVLSRYNKLKSAGLETGNRTRKEDIYDEYSSFAKFLSMLSENFGLNLKDKKEEETRKKELLDATIYFYTKFLEKT